MKHHFTVALGAFALSACQPAMTEDELEVLKATIRTTAEQQGLSVKQLDIQGVSENQATGSAIVFRSDNPGREVRWDCNAQRSQGTKLQWHCAPSGQAQVAPGPPPQPVLPAADDSAAFVGRWTETGDCGNVTLLNADGTFVVPDGSQGNWDVQGTQLTLTGPNGSATVAIYLNDASTMLLTTNDGNTTTLTRC